LVNKLRAAGFAQEQAEAVVRAIADSHKELVTKDYLDIRLGPIYTDLALLKMDGRNPDRWCALACTQSIFLAATPTSLSTHECN